jgi:hypothetical protein
MGSAGRLTLYIEAKVYAALEILQLHAKMCQSRFFQTYSERALM